MDRDTHDGVGEVADVLGQSPGLVAEDPAGRRAERAGRRMMISRSMRLDLMRAVSRAGLVGRPRAKPRLNTGQPKGWPVLGVEGIGRLAACHRLVKAASSADLV